MKIGPLELPADRERIEPLLIDRLHQPYSVYAEVRAHPSFRRFSLGRAFDVLRHAGTEAVIAEDGGLVVGLGCWSRLAWDSEWFGFPAARLDFLAARGDYVAARRTEERMLWDLLSRARAAGIRHLTARVDAGDLPATHALERAGFELIDAIQTFSLRLPAAPGLERNGFSVRLFREQDLESVLAIARSAYVYDRFHADAALDAKTADAVNEAWVRNCCLGKAADAVVVAGHDDSILGYATCRVDRRAAAELGASFGSIVMVATAAGSRQQGVAKAVSCGALDWFRNEGVTIVEVGTQLRNIPACCLYQRCGFRVVANSLTFRKLL